MACQGLNLLHAWILPKDDLVQRVAVSAYDLVGCLREHKVAHLRTGVYSVKWLESVCIPESDVTVCSATSGC